MRSTPCPDMYRWQRWLRSHPVTYEARDISRDAEARADLRQLVGSEAVPTLVIAEEGEYGPAVTPEPLDGRRTRATDRGTVISEPRPEQLVPFLARHGIDVPGAGAEVPEAASAAGVARHEVTVYPIAGRQLFFRIPESFCRECDFTIDVVERVSAEFDDVRVRVKPWLNHLAEALWRGGWHAPVVTIDGRVYSQGVVPEEAAFRDALARLERPAARPQAATRLE
ncbi:MAG: glutaredoxin family protein [Dehalococcoidia bacterium]